MSLSFFAHTIAGNTGLSVHPEYTETTGITTTGADRLILASSYYTGSSSDFNTLDITETVNGSTVVNTWVQKGHKNASSAVGVTLWESVAPAHVGVNHVIRITTNAGTFYFGAVGLIACSGSSSYSFEAASAGTAGTATTTTTAALSPSSGTNFLVGICVPPDEASGTGATPAVTAGGYTLSDGLAATHAVTEGLGLATLVNGGASSNCTFGTWTSNPCAGIQFSWTATPDTLAINSPQQGQVYQRTKGTGSALSGGTATVPISGSYTGTDPSTSGWTAIDNNSNSYNLTGVSVNTGAKTWTANVPGVASGDGIKINSVTDNRAVTTTSAQSTTWGVGRLEAWIGDSIAEWEWTQQSSSQTVATHAYITNGNGWWGADKVITSGSSIGGGACWPINVYLTKMRAAISAAGGGNMPIGILCYGIGGTRITTWVSGQSSWTAFTNASTGVNSSNANILSDFEDIKWLHGFNDVDATLSPGPATYYATDLAALYTQSQSLTGRNTSQLKFCCIPIGSFPNNGGLGDPSDAYVDTVRSAIYSQASQTGCYLGGTQHDLIHNSSVSFGAYHYDAAGYVIYNTRLANGTLYTLGASGYTSPSLGPVVSSATMAAGSSTVVVTLSQNGGASLKDGTGSGAGTGLLGWNVNVNGTPTAPTTTAISGNTVVLSMGFTRTNQTLTLDYAAGANFLGWGAWNASETNDHATFDNQSSYLGTSQGFPVLFTPGGRASPITISLANTTYSPILILGAS